MTNANNFVLNNLQNKGWFGPQAALFSNNAIAYDAQDAALAVLAAGRGAIGGYKIAYNSPAQLTALGQSGPGAAYICADQIAQSGVTLSDNDYENLMIEPEIAAVLGQDVTPGQHYGHHDIAALVTRWCPAFELLDRRNTDGHFHVPTVLAHNIFNEGAVMGLGGVAVLPDMAALRSQVFEGDKRVHDATGSAPQDPLDAACHLINHFTGRGQVMKAGTVLLCGTHMPIYKPTAGQDMRFDLGALGSVSFSLA